MNPRASFFLAILVPRKVCTGTPRKPDGLVLHGVVRGGDVICAHYFLAEKLAVNPETEREVHGYLAWGTSWSITVPYQGPVQTPLPPRAH